MKKVRRAYETGLIYLRKRRRIRRSAWPPHAGQAATLLCIADQSLSHPDLGKSGANAGRYKAVLGVLGMEKGGVPGSEDSVSARWERRHCLFREQSIWKRFTDPSLPWVAPVGLPIPDYSQS